jgi:hypothetical protein
LADQTQRVLRGDVPNELVAVEVELAFQCLMFRMEVLRFVWQWSRRRQRASHGVAAPGGRTAKGHGDDALRASLVERHTTVWALRLRALANAAPRLSRTLKRSIAHAEASDRTLKPALYAAYG